MDAFITEPQLVGGDLTISGLSCTAIVTALTEDAS
jgi:hypothetical protein